MVNIQRKALGIEYDGARYCGFQRQRLKPSIQMHLESALSKIAGHPIRAYCAGRTDRGVHASFQVLHFDTNALRAEIAWLRGANTYLPRDIRVLWSKTVDSHFDARKSAISRRYCYVIANQAVSPGILSKGTTWVLPTLDVALMQKGAQFLLGKHDFSSFRAAHCQAKTPIKTIYAIDIIERGRYIVLDVTANAFLYHMVRNIVGSLIKVGQGKATPCWIKEVLEGRDRRLAGFTAPSEGLYLTEICYPEEYGIPRPDTPWFL